MKLATIGAFRSEFEATLAKDALEANGIRASFAGGYPAIGLGGYSLLVVDQKDLKRAVKILKEVKKHDGTNLEWTWPPSFHPSRLAVCLVILAFLILGVMLKWF